MSARYRFQLRRGTTAEWTTDDPVLLDGEPAIDETTGELRIGDGVSVWSDLEPVGAIDAADVAALIASHDASGTAHADIRASVVAVPRPLIHADWAVKVLPTGGSLPALEMFPGDDIAAWESADVSALGVPSGGVPAVWAVPVDEGVQRILYADLIDTSRCGVYDYTPGVSFVRSADANTTAKLHGKLVASKTNRYHSDLAQLVTDEGAGRPGWMPNTLRFEADDPTLPIGTAMFNFSVLAELRQLEVFFSFLTSMTGYGWTPNSADWSGVNPAQFGEALDRLAAHVGPVPA